MAYIAKADVEGLLGAFTISAHWTADSNAQLNAAIARAAALIDSVTHNHFEAESRTMTLRGDATRVLSTAVACLWPINTVTSVWVKSNWEDAFDADGDLIEAEYYQVSRSRRALLYINDNWTSAEFPNYRVIGTFGRSVTPAMIKKAAVLLVQEDITPGTIAKYDQFASEKFPDGYSYVRGGAEGAHAMGQQRLAGATTGYPVIDNILKPFQLRRLGLAIGM